jgi:ectoine hydroxylase-related dioxygenase (phytanoyl-CoA dioxygenase family)
MGSNSAPLPRSIQRVPATETEKLFDVIKEDGCVIITGFTSPELLDQVNAEVSPYLLADKPWKGALFPPETRRCPRLVARSKTVREHWLCSDVVTNIIDQFLSTTTSNYYGEEKHTYTSKPQVNTTLTMEINPGAKAQRLHRDDKNHHNRHFDMTKTGYQLGADTGLGFLVPGVQTTVENGATWAIPGSHLWDAVRVPTPEEVTYACMMPGEAFCMLGGLYHAGGANTTTDQKRPMHGLFFIRGIYRQEVCILIFYFSKPREHKSDFKNRRINTWSTHLRRFFHGHLKSRKLWALVSPLPISDLWTS